MTVSSTTGADREEMAAVRPPAGPEVFHKRAARLGALAPGHAAGDFLAFLAKVATAQGLAWERIAPLPLGGDARVRPPPAAWREALAVILSAMEGTPAPAAAQAAMARLRRLSDPALDALAQRILSGDIGEDDAALAPLAGAALQVAYTALAARSSVAPPVNGHADSCPACGSPPVAGVVLADDRLRYLECALCSTQWHRTRVQCATCGEGGGLTYFTLDPEHAAVKAEACRHCRTFLKLYYLESDPRAEPFVDDVATLTLDLLVAGEGYARGGVSCFWT